MELILGEQPNPKQAIMLRDTHRYICYGGAKGGGKAMPLDEPVLTPFGYRKMGDLCVGNKVIGADGKAIKIIQIHPQGVQKIYKVRTIDGAETRVTGEHLWLTKYVGYRQGWHICDTDEMIRRISTGRHVLIPLAQPVQLTPGSFGGSIKPYTLGALLGDGCLLPQCGATITSADEEIINRIEADGYELVKRYKDNGLCNATVKIGKDARAYLKANDLLCRSEFKHIPNGYKFAPIEYRLEVLRGLMDTDGYADVRGHCEYCSISKQLAEDVQWLVWSMGGKATITEKDPVCVFPDGHKKVCKTAYIVYIQTRDNSLLFNLTRKRERCEGFKYNGGNGDLNRRIVSIEPCGEAECQCITVEASDGLYVAKDFIVTHNSWALRTKAALLAAYYPGIQILMLRRTMPELSKNIIMPLYSMLFKVCSYNKNDKIMLFPNGSKIYFGYCDSDGDVLRYQGQEYDVLMIDEATLFMESWFVDIDLCVRGANNFPKRTYLTCNPGGVGHEWVKRLFIKRQFDLEKENPDDYTFIPAKVQDNTALLRKDPNYMKRLLALPKEKRAALLYGNWDSFEGRFFPEFTRDTHVVEPFPIPAHWRKYRALDYGLDMLACLWIAVDEQGYEYVYRELHQPNMIAAEAARKIVEFTGDEEIYATFAPPDLWARSKESAKTVAELFRENGVVFTQADNNRINGWQQVKDHIKLLPDLLQPIKDKPTRDDIVYAASPNYIDSRERARMAREQEAKKPTVSRLRVFSTCLSLINDMCALQYDDKKIGDASAEPHDISHSPDSLRYYCVSRTLSAKPLPDTQAIITARLKKAKSQSRARRLRAT